MTRKEAKEYVKEHYGITLGKNADSLTKDSCVLLRLRKNNYFLPQFGIDGSLRDGSEWAFIDSYEKIETEQYGAVRYF